jgi:hypothetical protein
MPAMKGRGSVGGTVLDFLREDRVPHDPDTGRAVLGGIIVDNAALGTVRGLGKEEFFKGCHHRIYRAIRTLAERGGTRRLWSRKAEGGCS